MSSGTVDQIKDRVKEATGALVADEKLKREGQADQFAGKVKDIAEKVANAAKGVVKGD